MQQSLQRVLTGLAFFVVAMMAAIAWMQLLIIGNTGSEYWKLNELKYASQNPRSTA